MNPSDAGNPTDPRIAREAAMVHDLSDPANLPGEAGSVEVARTHGSLVFLTEHDVYKLKRAVDFGFFDFTTLEARRADCEAELRLNRRTAREVYIDILPVYEDADGFSFTRARSQPVDWAVHMRRLPDAARADVMLSEDRLTAEHLESLAAAVARFHLGAEATPPAIAELRTNIEENFDQTRDFVGRHLDRATFDALRNGHSEWLDRHRAELEVRAARDGHGDLRLEHAYLLDDGPVVIDCIEFNDRFRIADPALDVAFLAMDLHRADRPRLAEVFLGAYAYEADDYDFYPLIDGYMSYRAFVRAKVAGFVADDAGASETVRARKRAEARDQFALALALLTPREGGRVIAVGGLPGSGKSTVARTLRRLVGGPIVSADATRKHLAGITHDQRANASVYTREFSRRVHAELLRRASRVLASGRPVIFDTTFHGNDTLDRVAAFANEHGVRFDSIECCAPLDELRRRIRQRRGDVSDADEAVLERFLTRAPGDEVRFTMQLDTTATTVEQIAALRDELGLD